jgi:uncharacterized membrane protein YtjA (UPF0391 family)
MNLQVAANIGFDGTFFPLARSSSNQQGRSQMLYYALLFLVVAIVAGALGFGGIAGASVGIAKILFVVFLVLFLASLVFGGLRRAR